jgi:hypothetical protein
MASLDKKPGSSDVPEMPKARGVRGWQFIQFY